MTPPHPSRADELASTLIDEIDVTDDDDVEGVEVRVVHTREQLARLCQATGGEQPWMRVLVTALRRFHSSAVDPEPDLAAWIRRGLVAAEGSERLSLLHFSDVPPEMSESRWRVPALATPRELATWLGIGQHELVALADRAGLSRAASDPRRRHYRYAWIAKARAGHRLLEAPKRRLREVQRRILDGIVGCIAPHDAAHGFRTGHSVGGFAAAHVGRAVVIRVDLRDFFTSVTAARVAGLVRIAGYPSEVARVIASLCTHRTPRHVLATSPTPLTPGDRVHLDLPHLPQGAPTSGALANLAAYRIDVRVAALAARLGAHYSRYADDLVLSGDRDLAHAAPTLVARLGAIACEEGFALNFRKTRVMTAGDRQQITGLVVNSRLGVPRTDVERLRATLHNCVRFGPATQNRDGHPDFAAHLRGRVAWVASIDARKGARLRAEFDRIAW